MGLQILDTTYSGTHEVDYLIANSLFGLDTVKKGGSYIKTGIRKKHTMLNTSVSDVLRAKVATPEVGLNVADVSPTITGRVIDPQDVMIYWRNNPSLFSEHALVTVQSNKLLERGLPNSIEFALIDYVMNIGFQSIERAFHLGSSTYTAVAGSPGNGQLKWFDGFIKKGLAGSAILVPGFVAITAGNVLARMDASINQLPIALLYNPDVKFEMSYADYQLFELASLAMPNKGIDIDGRVKPMYRGYQVLPLAGLPKDTFYLSKATSTPFSNKYIGMNDYADMNFIYDKYRNDSLEYFVRADMQFDVQIANPVEFIMHTGLTLASFNV